MNKRTVGKEAEDLVKLAYEKAGYQCKKMNFTIRGGELDIVVEASDIRVFVEVKVINYLDDIHEFLSDRKRRALLRTIEFYNYRFPTAKQLRIDVVFVHQNRIVHVFKNVDLYR